MVALVKKLRPLTVLAVAAAAYFYEDSNPLRAAPIPMCEEMCTHASCDTQCWINNELMTTCGDYGVCEEGGGGDPGGGDPGGGGPGGGNPGGGNPNCPSPSTPVIVNGSFDTFPPWVQPGSGERAAIAYTYCTEPYFFPWVENDIVQILPPYLGMIEGAFDLAGFLNFISGERNVIAHSHGGNVVLLSTWAGAPEINHLINLATPVNYDFGFFRFIGGTTVNHRCQVSTGYTDWTQFAGASPALQIYPFAYDVYLTVWAAIQAGQAAFNDDWEAFLYYTWLSAYAAIDADSIFWSTKIEVDGPTYLLYGYQHSDMHEPAVWSQIVGACALN